MAMKISCARCGKLTETWLTVMSGRWKDKQVCRKCSWEIIVRRKKEKV